ncbi:hypothetical protein [Nocardioides sp.]|uniref:hypothetical protein n=1 Tax=Nocardioides sp. TaxID=35761 RepID=UPI002728070D|nr:hypothetical protein [Nocardioides sp.]MDO9457993.1 hypothetical protein [Nocardioides sp.]
MSTDESVRAEPADDAAEGDGSADPSRRRGGARRKPRRERRATAAPAATGDTAVVIEPAGDGPPDDGDSTVHPRFWHRDHPVFTPLSGFFTGVLLVVVVLGLLGAILEVVGYDVSAHPWVFLVALGVLLALNLVLVVVGSTRRFARYMLFGILTTPTVVFLVASLTFWLLLNADG